MLWKAFVFTALVAGVFCKSPVIDDKRKQRIHEYVETMCTKNNAKDKVSQVEAAIYSFVDCIYEHQDESIIQDLNNIDDQQSVITVYKRVCKKVPEFKTCFYKLMDEVSICGGKDSVEELTEAKKFLDELLEYLCGNDAEKFVKFVEDDSLQCLDQKKKAIEKCVTKASKDLGSSEEDSSSESNSAEIKEACSTFDDLKKCMHTTLKECPKQTAGEFIDGMFGLIRKASRCNKFD